jgi:hypothetical protein
MDNDPGEAKDISSEYPKKLQTLIKAYEDYDEQNGVVEIKIDLEPLN